MKSREDLIKENIELERICMRYKKGLNDIKKHLDLIGGSAVCFSSTYMIATKALQQKLTEPKKDIKSIRNTQIEFERKLKEEATPTQKDMDDKFTI